MTTDQHCNDTVKGRYSKFLTDRDPYEKRAEEASLLTIPALFPRKGHTANSILPTPFQSIGARGVNTLASKLLLALLPPNNPFFKLQIDEFTITELSADPKAKTQIENALASIERDTVNSIETSSLRVDLFECLKHLIVTGNSLLYLPPDGSGGCVFPLSKYVVKRDPSGNVLEIITLESLSNHTLTPELQALLSKSKEDCEPGGKALELYTHIERCDGMWEVKQELEGIVVPDSEGTYPLDNCPWIPIRFTKIDNEDYGRGFVEEYLGDLYSLEGLSQAIVEGAAAAAKILFLVKPGGQTKIKTIASAKNAAVVQGDAADVTVLQAQKFYDFRTAQETADRITERLSAAFMLTSAVQRQAERVTAEEIRLLAKELEESLGGIYSVLSQELQLPMVRVIMANLTRKGKLPKLPKNIVKPMIVTGLDALGRGYDREALVSFLQTLTAVLGSDVMKTYIEVSEAITRLAVSSGIDTKGLVKPPEVVAQEQQQQQQMAMMQQLGPNAVNAVGKMAAQAQQQQPTQ